MITESGDAGETWGKPRQPGVAERGWQAVTPGPMGCSWGRHVGADPITHARPSLCQHGHCACSGSAGPRTGILPSPPCPT